MKTLIRLLLQEQSDLGLHCLPRLVCPKTLGECGGLVVESLTPEREVVGSIPISRPPYDVPKLWIITIE